MAEPPLRFAALGLDHRHIYHQVGRLLELGCECAGYWTDGDPQPLGGFLERFPDLERVGEPGRLLDDPAIHLIVSAAVPAERAGIAMRSMRRGKDVMVDKPGVTSLLQLEEVKRVQAETGRIWSVDFSERFEVRAMTRAAELVDAGAIGEVVHLTGFGPHRLNRHLRPPWFFDPERTGGILCDLASHQIDQFLYLTRAPDAEVVASTVANRPTRTTPGSRTTARCCFERSARPASSGWTGTRRTAFPPGATGALRCSGPAAPSRSASTSTLRARPAPTTCSWWTGRIRGASTAATLRFHKTVLNEFYRVAFRKKLYHGLEELQCDLDEWMEHYNEVRTHQGRWCYGKTPMQTFLDTIELAREKRIAA